ncbi:hypothetical protein KAK07_21545 [Ideonella sp. 4Y16]|uniref:Uncharacterized protein n=1 Tax=Ideonella alba TaxID=2824118 RepID=A0A940YC37_9BURK|nr:hypothetical protein [Ideonella alba]MBQ0932848.1 hypothetical protein [Ideonella alba]MBQ0945940.1 hypothetical protein [Ideonella alba]
MKKLTPLLVMGAAGLLAAVLGSPAQAAEVGVSIGISQPGVYGRIDIGRFPQPDVIVQQPVVVRQVPVYSAPPQPVYLWVPPGHRKHWSRHCGRYNACGVPVYFVREDWYRRHVAPAPVYRSHPRYEPHGPGEHGRGRGHD